MRNPLSDKVVEMKPSGIRKFFDIVSEMKDAISLGVGTSCWISGELFSWFVMCHFPNLN